MLEVLICEIYLFYYSSKNTYFSSNSPTKVYKNKENVLKIEI